MPRRVEGCVFCAIVAREAPGTLRYEDGSVLVFDNVLRWAPVMLLVVPREHMTQAEMWSGGMMERVGQVAVRMGEALSPGGFRLLSNFGRDAMQSQGHAHLHVIGGARLGMYI